MMCSTLATGNPARQPQIEPETFMPPKSFTATLQRPEGVGTWTYLTVPFDVLAEYGVKGQVKVQGTINGAFFRGSLMPHGDGRHFLVVKKSLRDQAGAAQGSLVKV